MLGQRRRRWANIKQTLFQCVVFAGVGPELYQHFDFLKSGNRIFYYYQNINFSFFRLAI